MDLIVIGSGAAGMMSAIVAAREGKKVLLIEKLPKLGAKLKATGGGRCNLTNTLDNERFMARFGRHGKFMRNALDAFDHQALISFFNELGVESHAPDGYRVFPKTHNSETILTALEKELTRLHVKINTNESVEELLHVENHITGVKTNKASYEATYVIVATGGLGYPKLGATGDGQNMATHLGHKVSDMYPAMMPLLTKETWVENCRADTIPKVTLHVNLPKYKKYKAMGDLIFTKNGIRGPVVLDFAREVTPLLEKYDEVPLLLSLTQGKNEEEIRGHIKKHAELTVLVSISKLLPESVTQELCQLVDVPLDVTFKHVTPAKRDELIKLLVWTPLNVTGHDGFDKAMITRGGVSLKEIRPESMESKLISGLYFCGEVVDLDGPCGGYNLQWSFASGFLAGKVLSQ